MVFLNRNDRVIFKGEGTVFRLDNHNPWNTNLLTGKLNRSGWVNMSLVKNIGTMVEKLRKQIPTRSETT